MIDFLLAHAELDGVFNATAPNPATSRDFARTLGRVLHRPALLPAPALVFRAAFGEMSRLLLTGQRVLPARALEAGFRFRFPELEPALRDVLG
jgi:NAD dependent epimerase/dehydratase family enzyme